MALELTFEHKRTAIVEFMARLWRPEHDQLLVVQEDFEGSLSVERWYRTRGRMRQDTMRNGSVFRSILADFDMDKIYCVWPRAGFYKEMPRWQPRPQFDHVQIGTEVIDDTETVHHRCTSTNLMPMEMVIDYWWDPSGRGSLEHIKWEVTKWCEGVEAGNLEDLNVPGTRGAGSGATMKPPWLPSGTYTVVDEDEEELPPEIFRIPNSFRLRGTENGRLPGVSSQPARSVSDLVRQAINRPR